MEFEASYGDIKKECDIQLKKFTATYDANAYITGNRLSWRTIIERFIKEKRWDELSGIIPAVIDSWIETTKYMDDAFQDRAQSLEMLLGYEYMFFEGRFLKNANHGR